MHLSDIKLSRWYAKKGLVRHRQHLTSLLETADEVESNNVLTDPENVLVPTLRVVLAITWTGQKVLRELDFLKQLQPRTCYFKKMFSPLHSRLVWVKESYTSCWGRFAVQEKHFCKRLALSSMKPSCFFNLRYSFVLQEKILFLPSDKFDANPL